jgi:WD40 repeat protein
MKRSVLNMQPVVWLYVAFLGIVPGCSSRERHVELAEQVKERATLTGHTDYVICVTFSPDGKALASGSCDDTIKLWDAATAKDQATLKGHTQFIRTIAYSPDGKTLASGSRDDTIKLWDVMTGKEKATIKGHSDLVTSLAFHPNGKSLASASFKKSSCGTWQRARSRLP